MLSNIGPGMFILIILVALLLFGPSKLPELGRAFGKTLREFKNGAKEVMNDDDHKEPQTEPPRKEVGPGAQTQAHQAETQPPRKDEARRLPD